MKGIIKNIVENCKRDILCLRVGLNLFFNYPNLHNVGNKKISTNMLQITKKKKKKKKKSIEESFLKRIHIFLNNMLQDISIT